MYERFSYSLFPNNEFKAMTVHASPVIWPCGSADQSKYSPHKSVIISTSLPLLKTFKITNHDKLKFQLALITFDEPW